MPHVRIWFASSGLLGREKGVSECVSEWETEREMKKTGLVLMQKGLHSGSLLEEWRWWCWCGRRRRRELQKYFGFPPFFYTNFSQCTSLWLFLYSQINENVHQDAWHVERMPCVDSVYTSNEIYPAGISLTLCVCVCVPCKHGSIWDSELK